MWKCLVEKTTAYFVENYAIKANLFLNSLYTKSGLQKHRKATGNNNNNVKVKSNNYKHSHNHNNIGDGDFQNTNVNDNNQLGFPNPGPSLASLLNVWRCDPHVAFDRSYSWIAFNGRYATSHTHTHASPFFPHTFIHSFIHTYK